MIAFIFVNNSIRNWFLVPPSFHEIPDPGLGLVWVTSALTNERRAPGPADQSEPSSHWHFCFCLHGGVSRPLGCLRWLGISNIFITARHVSRSFRRWYYLLSSILKSITRVARVEGQVFFSTERENHLVTTLHLFGCQDFDSMASLQNYSLCLEVTLSWRWSSPGIATPWHTPRGGQRHIRCPRRPGPPLSICQTWPEKELGIEHKSFSRWSSSQ